MSACVRLCGVNVCLSVCLSVCRCYLEHVIAPQAPHEDGGSIGSRLHPQESDKAIVYMHNVSIAMHREDETTTQTDRQIDSQTVSQTDRETRTSMGGWLDKVWM